MTDSAARSAARRMWALYEPVHAVTYFAPEAQQAWAAAGLRGFWRGYFAGRTAPMGAVGAPVVIAAYFNFAPSFVGRALPSVWELITPEQALAAREAGAVGAIRRLVESADGKAAAGAAAGGGAGQKAGTAAGAAGSAAGSLARAADLLAEVVPELEWAGRPIGGPNAALPLPADPVARLWHAATALREHRGDGHVAALVTAGLDGCEALALRVGVNAAGAVSAADAAGAPVDRDRFLAIRGWTESEWAAAAGRLCDRGWLDSAGVATAAGLAAHRDIEETTDRAAARPWASLGTDRTDELTTALTPVAVACGAALPYPNPIGVPPPGVAEGGAAPGRAAPDGVASDGAAPGGTAQAGTGPVSGAVSADGTGPAVRGFRREVDKPFHRQVD